MLLHFRADQAELGRRMAQMHLATPKVRVCVQVALRAKGLTEAVRPGLERAFKQHDCTFAVFNVPLGRAFNRFESTCNKAYLVCSYWGHEVRTTGQLSAEA